MLHSWNGLNQASKRSSSGLRRSWSCWASLPSVGSSRSGSLGCSIESAHAAGVVWKISRTAFKRLMARGSRSRWREACKTLLPSQTTSSAGQTSMCWRTSACGAAPTFGDLARRPARALLVVRDGMWTAWARGLFTSQRTRSIAVRGYALRRAIFPGVETIAGSSRRRPDARADKYRNDAKLSLLLRVATRSAKHAHRNDDRERRALRRRAAEALWPSETSANAPKPSKPSHATMTRPHSWNQT